MIVQSTRRIVRIGQRSLSINASDGASFDRIVAARRCAVRIDENRVVPRALLRDLLSLTLRTPSSFNMTPYRIILAESPRFRARIADCMLGGANAARAKNAPVNVIFFADYDAMARVDDVAARESRAGARPAGYLRSLKETAGFFASSRSSCVGAAGSRLRAAVSGAVASLSRVPLPAAPLDGGAAWAQKNTGMAAMSFMLAAASRGLATYPMEGFDAGMLTRAMSFFPDEGGRWEPALVIATGWEAVDADAVSRAESTRPELAQMVTVDGPNEVFLVDFPLDNINDSDPCFVNSKRTVPRRALKGPPEKVTLAPGEEKWICSCGLSKTYLSCDGSHKETTWRPFSIKNTGEAEKTFFVCACGSTGKADGTCDGSHRKVVTAVDR